VARLQYRTCQSFRCDYVVNAVMQFGDMKGIGYFVQMFIQGMKYTLRVLSKKVRSSLTAPAVRSFSASKMLRAWEQIPLTSRLELLQESASHGNTSLVYHAQKLMVLEEGGLPYQLRTACSALLNTIGQVSFGGKLQHAFTAHPKIDAASKYMFSFGYSVESKPYCMRSVYDPAGENGR